MPMQIQFKILKMADPSDIFVLEEKKFAKSIVKFQVMTKNVIKIYVCVCFRPGGQLAETAPVLLFRA